LGRVDRPGRLEHLKAQSVVLEGLTPEDRDQA
jgi:hypothetical protein